MLLVSWILHLSFVSKKKKTCDDVTTPENIAGTRWSVPYNWSHSYFDHILFWYFITEGKWIRIA